MTTVGQLLDDRVERRGRAAGLRARFRFLLAGRGAVGLGLLSFILAVTLIGPLVAPHSLATPIGVPGSGPSGHALLGTDFLGRDVLSRLLHGGSSLLEVSLVSVAVAYGVGVSIGLMAALSPGVVDQLSMRFVDLLLIFPPLLLLLVLIVGAGTGFLIESMGIAAVLFPGVARIVRAAALEVSVTGYVESAIARGEKTSWTMYREVLPNIVQVVLTDFGVRFSGAVIIAASLSFLGFGSQPPAADWGLMISENRDIIYVNPCAVIAPALMIALLTISVNLLADAYTDQLGRGGE